MITDKEVIATAESILKAQDTITGGRVTYLRLLVRAAQEDLPKGSEPRAQLTRLTAMHERFYPLVLLAAEPHVPKGTKGRAVELHRRVNFARTALSALRNHVRAGGDVATLKPDTVTKTQLKRRPPQHRALSAKRAMTRAERESKALLSTLMALGEVDKAAAINEIQLIVGQLSQQLAELGAATPRRARAGGHGKIVPSASQVLRAQASPS